MLLELLNLSEAKKNFDKMETEVRNEEEFLKFIEQHKSTLETFAHECAKEEYDGVDEDDQDRGSDASSNVSFMVADKGLENYLISHGFNKVEIKAWKNSQEFNTFDDEYYGDSESYQMLSDLGYEVSEDYGYSGK